MADYNVYVSTQAGRAAMKDSGEHSVAIHGDVTFDEDRLLLSWKSASPLPTAPLLKNCELDFFGRERTADRNIPGPFLGWRTRRRCNCGKIGNSASAHGRLGFRTR